MKKRCAGQIGSLLELLQGKLSAHVMEVVTDRKEGLFPLPGEISFDCDCPDWAIMCKHVAAVLYGVGARLDESPELLFKLRGVNHEELIEADAEAAVSAATTQGKSKRLADGDLSDVFGIDIDAGSRDAPSPKPPKKKAKGRSRKTVKRKTQAAKTTVKKKPAKKATKSAGKKTVKKKVTRKTAKKKAAGKKRETKKTPKRPLKKKATKRTAKKAAPEKPRKKRT